MSEGCCDSAWSLLPTVAPGSLACRSEGQEAMGQGMAGPALSHGPRGSWSGWLCLVPGQSLDPHLLLPPMSPPSVSAGGC